MRQVLSVSTARKFPTWKQWKQLPSVLSLTEQRLANAGIWMIMLSIATMIFSFVMTHRIEIPTLGGEYTEGLVGEPQFINPLYATTNDVDADLSSLVYSGLLSLSPTQGLIPDLAEEYWTSEDGKTVSFRLRESAVFHNGDPVKVQDVLFTMSAIQNPAYRSPLAPQFKGVTVNQDDDRIVSFVLEKPSSTFLNTLTVGILPSSVWSEILPQNAPLAALNLQPIGSGPYEFSEFSKDKRGSILSYTLKANTDYYNGGAHIETLNFKFYPDAKEAMDAFNQKFVEGVSVIPFEDIQTVADKKSVTLHQPYLPDEVVLFFNEKTNAQLKDLSVRTAIAQAIDRNKIAQDVFQGTVRAIETPLLPGMVGYSADLHAPSFDLNHANELIGAVKIPEMNVEPKPEATEGTGETAEEPAEPTPEPVLASKKLTFKLTIMDRPEFQAVATKIQEQLAQINIQIEIVAIPADEFANTVIEPRNFELLLGSVYLQANPDLSLFWHSSQIGENGLNLSGYQNKDVDALLEKAQQTTSVEDRATLLRSIQEQILKDVPAVFLYQSTYPYATPKSIQNVVIDGINVPQDRFATIKDWFIKTKKTLK